MSGANGRLGRRMGFCMAGMLALGAAVSTGAHAATVEWGTYLGGTGADYGYAVAVDASGNVYATGNTYSAGWVSGGWDTTINGGTAGNDDGFVVKLNSSGAHVWSTYLGGTNTDVGHGIAVGGSGNVYVTGYTASAGWVSGGWDTTHDGGLDGYVVSLTPAGAHAWSTYLGGTETDSGHGIAVDGSGSVYATGYTNSAGWVISGWDTTHNGDYDGYIVKLSSMGLYAWSTYLGGTGGDVGRGIAVTGSGNVYATGGTNSAGWVSGGWDTTQNGSNDGYIVKLSSTGAHAWSTYLGGTGDDYGTGIAEDGSDNVYATGQTASAGWVSGGWDTTHNGGLDGYVVSLTPAGAHVRSTYLGGTGNDYGWGIAVYGTDAVYAVGGTNSAGWVTGGWDTTQNGGTDGYVVKLTHAGLHHVWSTYVGGTGTEHIGGIAARVSGTMYAVGGTNSAGWVSGGWDTTHNGGDDAHLIKIVGTGETGSLQVTLSPAGALADGAQWRLATEQTWHISGDTVSGLAAGEWRVEYKDVVGWAPPESQTVSVPANSTAQTTGTYAAVSVDMFWGTYLGGTSSDVGYGIAADGSGNVYVTGETYSTGWASGGWDTIINGGIDGNADGYVVKLTPAGAHAWSTYLGGTEDERGTGIAVDGSGNVYATGYTLSTGWVSGGWDTTQNGSVDGYVVKLTPSGTHAWSTYLGGTGIDYGYGIAVDGSGNVCATGQTWSAGWVSGGWDITQNGDYDGYVVNLTPSGTHAWSTYLGGTGIDHGYGIAVDGSGTVYATGYTDSAGWVSGGWDTTQNGGTDGYVVKLTPAGAHAWSTYLGGTNGDYGFGIAVDGSGTVYATGETLSAGWVSGGWDTTQNGGYDGYVVNLTPAGTHAWSTYLGGTGEDNGLGITVDGSGNVYATGYTASAGWANGGWDNTHSGGHDSYIVKLSSAGAHAWSTYLGGTGNDAGMGIAVDGSGNVYAAGYTYSENWLFGGWQTTYGGNADAFVVKISKVLPAAPTTPGATAIGTDTITWTWEDNSSDETGFTVWDDPGAGAPTTLQTTTAADTTSWTHGGLSVNTQYTFQVAATNANGDSAKTATFSAWTLAAVPAAPVVGNPSGTTLDLSVGAGDGNPADTEYALRCVTTGQWVQADGTLGASAVWQTAAVWGTVTVSGMAEYTGYTFETLARNGAGVETAAGPTASGMTLETVPPTAVVTLLDPTPTQATALNYSVTFSEPVAPTFDETDVSLTGGLAGAVAVGGADPVYTVTVTLTGVNPDGLTGIALGTDVQDMAGNGFAGAVSPDYDVVWWPGFAAPLAGAQGYTGDAGPALDASVAAGAPRVAAYQWRWDDGSKAVQDGPTTAAWDLGTLSAAMDGEYWCAVTYGGLVFETNHAGMQVRDRVSITAQPTDQTASPGGSATFTVAAAGGYTPLHYQWKKEGTNVPGSPDAAEWTLENVMEAAAGAYSVEVSDSHNDSTTSDTATLTVEEGVPAAGLLGLAALAGALAVAGRRRRGVRR